MNKDDKEKEKEDEEESPNYKESLEIATKKARIYPWNLLTYVNEKGK